MKRALETMVHYLDVTLVNIRMALLRVVEYPSNFVGWLLSNPIQFLVGFATIQFVVAEFGEINGWNYGQLAFLYGLAVLSHALSMIFFVQGWFMGNYVLQGEFDRFLTRPMSVLYQFFFTQVNIIGVTDLIPGLCVFLYGCSKVGFRWSIGNIFLIVVLLTGGTLIRGGIYIILGTTTFWTKSNGDFAQYTQEIFDKTTMYPLSMYPESIQFILTYLIPIGWVTFYPVSNMLGLSDSYLQTSVAVWVTFFAGILVMTLAALFFRVGLRNYESAGN
ncbi:MAG: ABC-2 family transporter protein [Clostridium sp.]|nr:ABC-2 family transporter protein [Clostridium sp.]MCM1399120.1 ABC-2 family transporter protein [Clostridium sp.]MCM1459512.1 ABC-2 family transporter protein [Bacteroides sp.]